MSTIQSIFLTIFAGLVVHGSVFAQSPHGTPNLFGSIDIEQDQDKVDSYGSIQQSLIDHFKALASQLPSLQSGTATRVPDLSEAQINFLDTAYLYCLTKSGSCPLVLNALLESDIINSRLAGTAECPTLRNFWRGWIKSDMEKRQSYLVPLGLVNSVEEFNKRERDKFIKCKDTVQTEMGASDSTSEYFKNRFKDRSPSSQTVVNMEKFLVEIKEKAPNIYQSTEQRFPSNESDQKADSKSATTKRAPAKR